MDDALLMREVKSLAYLEEDGDDGVLIRYDSCLEELVEVETGQELLNDVGGIVHDPVVEDKGDVPVDQVADELGFLLESLAHLVVRGGAQLDGHLALDEWVPRLVDDPETADGDLLDHLVLANHLRGRHGCYFSGNTDDAPQAGWFSPVSKLSIAIGIEISER